MTEFRDIPKGSPVTGERWTLNSRAAAKVSVVQQCYTSRCLVQAQSRPSGSETQASRDVRFRMPIVSTWSLSDSRRNRGVLKVG